MCRPSFCLPPHGLIGRNAIPLHTPLHRRGRRAGRWCWSRPSHQMTVYRCFAPRRLRVPVLGVVPRGKREQPPPPASRTSWPAFASTARSDGARSPAAAATIIGTRHDTTTHTPVHMRWGINLLNLPLEDSRQPAREDTVGQAQSTSGFDIGLWRQMKDFRHVGLVLSLSLLPSFLPARNCSTSPRSAHHHDHQVKAACQVEPIGGKEEGYDPL